MRHPTTAIPHPFYTPHSTPVFTGVLLLGAWFVGAPFLPPTSTPRARLERATCGLEDRCSIQLSYRGQTRSYPIGRPTPRAVRPSRLPVPIASVHLHLTASEGPPCMKMSATAGGPAPGIRDARAVLMAMTIKLDASTVGAVIASTLQF